MNRLGDGPHPGNPDPGQAAGQQKQLGVAVLKPLGRTQAADPPGPLGGGLVQGGRQQTSPAKGHLQLIRCLSPLLSPALTPDGEKASGSGCAPLKLPTRTLTAEFRIIFTSHEMLFFYSVFSLPFQKNNKNRRWAGFGPRAPVCQPLVQRKEMGASLAL